MRGTVSVLPPELTGRCSIMAMASSNRREHGPPGWVYTASGSPYAVPWFWRMKYWAEAVVPP